MKRILVIIAICAFISSIFGLDRKALNRNAEHQRANFAFIASEAFDEYMEGGESDNYMLLHHAYLADSSNLDVAAKYILSRLSVAKDSISLFTFMNYCSTIYRWYKQDPSDMYRTEVAGFFADQIGNINWQKEIWRNLIAQHPTTSDYYLGYARFLMSDAQQFMPSYIDTALQVLDECRIKCDEPEEVYPFIASCYLFKNDTTTFSNYIEQIASKEPTEYERLNRIGEIWFHINPDSALVYFNRSSQINPDINNDALAYTALLYSIEDDTLNYNRHVIPLLTNPEFDNDKRVDLLDLFVTFHSDNYDYTDSVETVLGQVEQLMPDNDRVEEIFSSFYFERDCHEQALPHLNRACDLNPYNVKCQAMRYDTSIGLGDTAAAIDYACQAAKYALEELDEDDEQNSNLRRQISKTIFATQAASLMNSTKQYQRAIDFLSSLDFSSVDDDESLSNVHTLLASSYFSLDQIDNAITHAQVAANLNTNGGTLNNLAYFLSVANRDLPQALKYIKMALAEDPDNASYVDTYAWILFQQKDYQEARVQADRLIELCNINLNDSIESDTIEIPDYDLFDTDSIDSDTTTIIEIIDVGYEEPSVDIYEHLGDIYFMTGDPDLAVKFWQRALALEPTNQRIRRKFENKTCIFDE